MAVSVLRARSSISTKYLRLIILKHQPAPVAKSVSRTSLAALQHFENHIQAKNKETNFSLCSLSWLQRVQDSLHIPTGDKDRRLAEDPDTQESNMKNLVAKFASDESGATAIEYGLIAALIAVAMIVGATSVGKAINAKFDNVAGRINAA